MKLDSRAWRTIGGLVLLVVVVLLGSRLGGDGTETTDSTSTAGTATDGGSAAVSPGARASTSTSTSTPGSGDSSDQGTDPDSGLAFIDESDLPDEARDVLAAIDAGGPFDYEGKDGSTFGNFEGVLPEESRGYYHEYTVRTPGSRDRGARRIVTGGPREDPTAYFWTDDHYDSFARVRR